MMKIIFIEDKPDARRQFVEWMTIKKIYGRVFESAYEASQHRAEFYFIDISAVTGGGLIAAYAPICKLIELHPGSRFVIMTFLSRLTVESIIDQVRQLTGVTPLVCNPMDGFEAIQALIS